MNDLVAIRTPTPEQPFEFAKYWGEKVELKDPERWYGNWKKILEGEDGHKLYLDGHISCCGASVISCFGDMPRKCLLESLDSILEMNKGHLYECILAEYQLEWEPELLSRGFEKVAEWHNNNSGNNCNLYILKV